jgi:F-type H+-transporting ATPase subunit b
MEFLATPEFWVAVSFFLFLGLVIYLGVHKKLAAETRRSIKEQFDRRMKLAEDKIARAEADALREVREAAANAAVAAAQTVIAAQLTPETADKLVKQGIDALKGKLN